MNCHLPGDTGHILLLFTASPVEVRSGYVDLVLPPCLGIYLVLAWLLNVWTLHQDERMKDYFEALECNIPSDLMRWNHPAHSRRGGRSVDEDFAGPRREELLRSIDTNCKKHVKTPISRSQSSNKLDV